MKGSEGMWKPQHCLFQPHLGRAHTFCSKLQRWQDRLPLTEGLQIKGYVWGTWATQKQRALRITLQYNLKNQEPKAGKHQKENIFKWRAKRITRLQVYRSRNSQRTLGGVGGVGITSGRWGSDVRKADSRSWASVSARVNWAAVWTDLGYHIPWRSEKDDVKSSAEGDSSPRP